MLRVAYLIIFFTSSSFEDVPYLEIVSFKFEKKIYFPQIFFFFFVSAELFSLNLVLLPILCCITFFRTAHIFFVLLISLWNLQTQILVKPYTISQLWAQRSWEGLSVTCRWLQDSSGDGPDSSLNNTDHCHINEIFRSLWCKTAMNYKFILLIHDIFCHDVSPKFKYVHVCILFWCQIFISTLFYVTILKSESAFNSYRLNVSSNSQFLLAGLIFILPF